MDFHPLCYKRHPTGVSSTRTSPTIPVSRALCQPASSFLLLRLLLSLLLRPAPRPSPVQVSCGELVRVNVHVCPGCQLPASLRQAPFGPASIQQTHSPILKEAFNCCRPLEAEHFANIRYIAATRGRILPAASLAQYYLHFSKLDLFRFSSATHLISTLPLASFGSPIPHPPAHIHKHNEFFKTSIPPRPWVLAPASSSTTDQVELINCCVVACRFLDKPKYKIRTE